MKILIIGGNSSLGSALIPVLEQFSEVITADRENCNITFDLNDPIDKIFFPTDLDVVIHTAAHFGGRTAKEMDAAETVNVLGTLKVCNASVQAGVKHFIFISSIFSQLNINSDFYSVYAISKKHSEELTKFFCKLNNLRLTILKPSQIYGNTDKFRIHQPFLYTLADKAENNEDIEFYGSNDAQRNFIHINDLVQIISKVIQNKVEGTYSCTHTIDISYSQIAKAALSAFNSKGNIRFLKDKADIPDNIFEKDDSLYKIIEYYPQISIEEGMKGIANYRRSKI